MAEESPKSGEGNQAVQAEMPHPGAGSHEVFVSYASHDGAVANAVVAALERSGLACWIAPRDVVPGSLYADGIIRAINDAKVLVLVLSASSVASKHVGKEVERASSKGRSIITLKVDAAPLTTALEYFLSESQWVDVGAGGMSAATAKLVEAVQRHLEPSAATEPRAHPDRPAVAPIARVQRKRWMVAGGVAVVVLALAYFVADKMWWSKQIAEEKPAAAAVPASALAALAIPDKSVAVLPFVDMSEKHDQEYFSDGLSEELIDMLSKVPELRVPARTSSFYFKGKLEDIPTIAKRLMVAHVLEGSVRKAGTKLRITAELIRADTGYHLWSETYDRNVDDIFKIQDEIAAAVVKQLRVTLSEVSKPRGGPPQNPVAYALYLQGRFFLDRGSKEDLRRAIDCLHQALQIDPTSALFWSGLSRAYSSKEDTATLSWEKERERALQPAEKALTIDRNLPEAHIARAKVSFIYDLDFAAAEAEIAKARELDPTDADALNWEATVAKAFGRLDEALRLQKQAIERDPLHGTLYNNMAGTLFFMGRYAEAEGAAREDINLNPRADSSPSIIGFSELLRGGNRDSALAEIAHEPDDDVRAGSLALASQIIGRTANSEDRLAEHEKQHANDDAYGIAQMHAVRGELDQSILWLERAYRQHEWLLTDIKVDPFLKSVRAEPRYKALLRKLKLPE